MAMDDIIRQGGEMIQASIVDQSLNGSNNPIVFITIAVARDLIAHHTFVILFPLLTRISTHFLIRAFL